MIGVCGGYQMLGERICDPYAMESSCAETTDSVCFRFKRNCGGRRLHGWFERRRPGGHSFSAYEIHLGETMMLGPDMAPFAVLDDGTPEGLRGDGVLGTYLHGALEDAGVLAELGIVTTSASAPSYDLLADWFAPCGMVFEELFL